MEDNLQEQMKRIEDKLNSFLETQSVGVSVIKTMDDTGRVVIPSVIRQLVGIEKGEKAEFKIFVRNGEIILKKN